MVPSRASPRISPKQQRRRTLSSDLRAKDRPGKDRRRDRGKGKGKRAGDSQASIKGRSANGLFLSLENGRIITRNCDLHFVKLTGRRKGRCTRSAAAAQNGFPGDRRIFDATRISHSLTAKWAIAVDGPRSSCPRKQQTCPLLFTSCHMSAYRATPHSPCVQYSSGDDPSCGHAKSCAGSMHVDHHKGCSSRLPQSPCVSALCVSTNHRSSRASRHCQLALLPIPQRH